MSGYLHNLVARALSPAPVVRPRPAARFEAPRSQEPVDEQELFVEAAGPRPSPTAAADVTVRGAEAGPRSDASIPTQGPARPAGPSEEAAARSTAGDRTVAEDTAVEETVPPRTGRPETFVLRVESSTPPVSGPSEPAAGSDLDRPESSRLLRPAARSARREPHPTVVPNTLPEVRVASAGRAREAAAPRGPRSAPEPVQREPVVEVTIGRIEVVARNERPAQPTARRSREPRLSLSDYLHERAKGQR